MFDWLCKIGLHNHEEVYVKVNIPKTREGRWYYALFGDMVYSHHKCKRCGDEYVYIPEIDGNYD